MISSETLISTDKDDMQIYGNSSEQCHFGWKISTTKFILAFKKYKIIDLFSSGFFYDFSFRE